MATNTPSLGLTLLGIGESAGTWGIPLNNNFSKIDILAAEIISARGSEADLNTRFSTVESEIGSARGVLPTLNDRLSVLLATDGNVNINNFPKSTQTNLGVTRLSVSPDDVAAPIAVGDNDGRLLSLGQVTELTAGGITGLHVHTLDLHVSDVTATSAEINQALDGINATVTAGNLNTLTGGGVVPKSMMTIPVGGYAYDGIVRLSATPSNSVEPIAVGDNDTRVLSQPEKDGLVTGNVTALHKHNLVDGAADVTLPAASLNQLTGMGTDVTASNLDILVGGGETSLHAHTNVHYTKSESDLANTANNDYADAAVASHNTDDTAHAGGNLNLGNITATSIDQSEAGIAQTIRSDVSDVDTQIKFEVKDRSGISKAYITTAGEVVADKITTRVHEVIETTTLSQAAVATSDLQVDGNAVIGNNNSVDVLTANVSLATFNGDVDITGTNGLTVGGTINGIDLSGMNTDLSGVLAEVLAARDGEATLVAKIVDIEAGADAVALEVSGARGGQADLDSRLDIIESTAASLAANTSNPHNVTITQAILADVGTGITVAELETLSDGSSADSLHTHAKYDTALDNALTSSVYGVFGNLTARLDASDTLLNNHTVEIGNARGGELSIDARLDGIDADILANVGDIATVVGEINTARNGQGTLDARLDGMAGDITALETEVVAGRDGQGSILDKMNLLETTADAVIAEVNNARNGAGSLDVRLDAIDGLISSNNISVTGDITALETEVQTARGGQANIDARLDQDEANLTTLTNEVIAGRGGQGSLDSRFDGLDTLVAALPGKYEEAFVSNTTFSVVHNLGSKAVTVQLRDTATDIMLPDSAITSITMTDTNTVDIVIGSATAVEVVVIG